MLAEDLSVNLVEIHDLRYSHGDREVFAGLNMRFPRGKVTAVLGPSGTGKSTLLRLITGQLNPSHGVVLFDGKTVCPCSRRHLYAKRSQVSQ